FFFQAEDGIRDPLVTGVQTCALPIYDYLRLLFARVGTPYCPDHGLALQSETVAQMVDQLLALPEDTRLMVLAPVVSGRKGEQVDLLEELRAQGFSRVRIDGKVHDLDSAA